ncbi:MAG TPA: transposase [Holophaga sp.]|nr:transposase [Holophaga sp.]
MAGMGRRNRDGPGGIVQGPESPPPEGGGHPGLRRPRGPPPDRDKGIPGLKLAGVSGSLPAQGHRAGKDGGPEGVPGQRKGRPPRRGPGERAVELLDLLSAHWAEKSPKAVDYVEEHMDSLLAVLDLPEAQHKRLRTTNMVERFNQELKRKSRLVRVWPNAESRERIYGALLMEQHEAWTGLFWMHMGSPA